MAGAATTKNVRDGDSTSFIAREWGETAGAAPFSAMPVLSNGEGGRLPVAEDSVHVSGDYGFAVWTVRANTPAATGANGDYVPFLSDTDGKLWVNAGELADDAAFTPATSKVLPAGFFADETGTDSVDEGDVGASRMTLDRKLITAPQPHSAGGLSIFRSIDLDEGTLEVVKGSPGCVYGMWVTNLATSTRFIKFYDATSGTAGTGTPVITIPIPGNSADDVTGNFGPGGMGIMFATGICVGAVTGIADNDTGAPGSNEVVVNIFFK